MAQFLQVDGGVVTATLETNGPLKPPSGRRFVEYGGNPPELGSGLEITNDDGADVQKFDDKRMRVIPKVVVPQPPSAIEVKLQALADKQEEILSEVKKAQDGAIVK